MFVLSIHRPIRERNVASDFELFEQIQSLLSRGRHLTACCPKQLLHLASLSEQQKHSVLVTVEAEKRGKADLEF